MQLGSLFRKIRGIFKKKKPWKILMTQEAMDQMSEMPKEVADEISDLFDNPEKLFEQVHLVDFEKMRIDEPELAERLEESMRKVHAVDPNDLV